MKKNISVLFLFVFSVSILSACGKDVSQQDNINIDSNKLTVVATLFPQYDFAK